MLSIICTAPIFGMEEANLPYVPKDICTFIDELSGDNGGANDSL